MERDGCDQVKHMNETVGNIVQSKEGWSLWEIDCLLYAAQINLAEQNKHSYIAIYHMDTSDQELSIGLGPGPGPGPSSSPTELNTRPSRITQEKSKRCYYKPKVQLSENMKIALAIIVSQERRNGKGWM